MPGSTEPERVPIMRPSSRVNPMVVATLRPSRIAAKEQPFPRWQVTSFREFRFPFKTCSKTSLRWVTYSLALFSVDEKLALHEFRVRVNAVDEFLRAHEFIRRNAHTFG